MAVSVSLENNALVVRTPYDAGFVAELKATVPTAERKWDGHRRAWLVASQYGQAMADMIARHYGQMVMIPQTAARKAAPELRVLEVRYLGSTKEREDGSRTAFAVVDGSWSAIFPEAALRAFFEGIQATEAPTQKNTLYSVLGVPKTAAEDEIKSAFRRLARQWHPDVCKEPNATDIFIRIREAYELLSDPNTRARYDAGLALEATLDRSESMMNYGQIGDSYRAPLRCGFVMAEGVETIGRFIVSKILQWEDIIDGKGRTLVTSWAAGADWFEESWV